MLPERKSWIDIAKCFGIFFIVLGHCCTAGDYFAYITYSFNSAIFFILSGMTFCTGKSAKGVFKFDERPLLKFIKKILNTIIIPYVIWALISISIYSIIGKSVTSSINTSMGNFSLIKNLWGMVYANSQTGFFNWNRPLWFLVCLVCVELIWYLLLSVFSKIKIRAAYIGFWVCMSISLIWMVSLAITKTYLRLPWEFETAVSMVFFFGIGLLLRCTEKLELLFAYLRKNKFVFIVLELSFIIINIVIAVINKDTDLRSDYYGNVFLYIPGALFGCMALLILAGTIKKQRLFEYTGTKTLAILV